MFLEMEIPDYFIKRKGYSEYDIKMYIANKLYEIGVIGTNCGGQIVGIDQFEFAKEMHKYGVGMIDTMTKEDIEKDIKNA